MALTKERVATFIEQEWKWATNVVCDSLREDSGAVWHAWITWTASGIEMETSIQLRIDEDDKIRIQ